MIPPRVVRGFIARELDDCRDIKNLRKEALTREFSRLTPPPVFHTKPYRHQLVAFLLGISYPRFLFFLDMGLGKTKVVLDLLRYYRDCGKMRRALVLVPNVANMTEWKMQTATHQPSMSVENIERADYVHAQADVVVCNYQRLAHLLSDKARVGRHNKLVPNQEAIKEFAANYDSLILDESTAIKNHLSLTHRIVRQLASRMRIVYALTGTPFGREPADLWPQFKVVDNGETLGDTIGLFREAFCKRVPATFGFGFNYVFKESMRAQLNRMIQHRSIQYSTEDCVDLPERVFTRTPVILGVAGRDIYDGLRNRLRAEMADGEIVEASFARLRQAASGFTVVDGENVLIKDSQGKLDAISDVLDNTRCTTKIVVFHEFIFSGETISQHLKSAKIRHVRLWSGTKDKEGVVRKFTTDPKCRVFVVNNQSGAFGLNLQVANYVLYYESPCSPIVRAQTEKRCHRVGQTKKVFYYDLVSRNTVDERILAFLRQGRDLREEILRGKQVL